MRKFFVSLIFFSAIYAEGINEEGLDAIIEEVGLDTFVDFVIDSAQDLNEERAARKMSARNLQTLKKKTIPAAKEAEAKRQKEKKGEYSAAYKKKETDVTVYDKAKAKSKAKVKPTSPEQPPALDPLTPIPKLSFYDIKSFIFNDLKVICGYI